MHDLFRAWQFSVVIQEKHALVVCISKRFCTFAAEL